PRFGGPGLRTAPAAAGGSGPASRWFTATSAPASANTSAIALPIPRAAPVTSATRPLRSVLVDILRLSRPTPHCAAGNAQGERMSWLWIRLCTSSGRAFASLSVVGARYRLGRGPQAFGGAGFARSPMLGGEWRPGVLAHQPLVRLGASRSAPRRGISVAGTLLGGVTGFLLGAAFWIVPGLKEPSNGDAARLALPWEPACT